MRGKPESPPVVTGCREMTEWSVPSVRRADETAADIRAVLVDGASAGHEELATVFYDQKVVSGERKMKAAGPDGA